MSFNPFKIRPMPLDKCFEDWQRLYPKAYNSQNVDPFTKLRVLLAEAMEYESQRFSHELSQSVNNNDLRRELALLRRIEQQQLKKIALLHPFDETVLQRTISLEQLEVELSAIFFQREHDKYARTALNFALVEDFDHLYRFSELLMLEEGLAAEQITKGLTEIMPGRPSISAHRYPYDDVRRYVPLGTADSATPLHLAFISAVEQFALWFYGFAASVHPTELGRKLYTEIGLLEEQHLTQYNCLIDPNRSPLEKLLLHEYAECYLYASLMADETDTGVRDVWESNLNMEIAHLHAAADLLLSYEKKSYEVLIPDGNFPELLEMNRMTDKNKRTVRAALADSLGTTSVLEEYAKAKLLPESYAFFIYNDALNRDARHTPSHNVAARRIAEAGEDYRLEELPHPAKELRDRHQDNTTLGRE